MPSPQISLQGLTQVPTMLALASAAVLTVHVHPGVTPEQSSKHPNPSLEFPSSQISDASILKFPHY